MATCFVIQPFDRSRFDARYRDILKPAIQEADFEPYRVDEDPSVSIPIEQIEKAIRESAVCVADITLDNANVWFELGYAIACQKPLVMICERTARQTFPFDVQHRSIIAYDTQAPSDFHTLREKIVARLKTVDKTKQAVEALSTSQPLSKMFDILTRFEEQSTELSELREKIGRYETWDAEVSKYELVALGSGTTVYRLRNPQTPAERGLNFCVYCFGNRKRVILQNFYCQECKHMI